MNQVIIDNINKIVKADDTLFILGDIFMGPKEKAYGWLEQIKCRNVTVVLGNHDSNKWKQEYYRSLGWDINNYVVIARNCFRFFCHHYPIEETGQNLYTKQDIYLYGHLHSKAPKGLQDDNTYHVGLDTNNLYPVSIKQIIKEYYER
jgi:calcineurin-like phosphoesterase family protein